MLVMMMKWNERKHIAILFIIAVISSSIVFGLMGYSFGKQEKENLLLIEIADLMDETVYYKNRYYTEALADFLYIQLYMYPFNSNDTVTLEYSGLHNEIICVNHTEPNPDYLPFRYVYRYRIHFDRTLTFEEMD